MRFGVCVNPYWFHGWTPPIPGLAAWQVLHDKIGITGARVSVPLQLLFPEENVENWKLTDPFIYPLAKAGIRIYSNPNACPPWASQGQPAYIGSIAGWPPETPVPPAAWGGTGWWDDPEHGDPAHVHFFDQDPNRTDGAAPSEHGLGVGPRRLTGPELAAIDQKLPARPYLKNPPHRDPFFYDEFAGFRITMQYGGMIESSGVENEPGGDGDPVMRFLDKAYNANGSDTIRDRFFPEIVRPYTEGVLRANPNMLMVGPEADSDEVLDRLCALEDAAYRARPSLGCYDILSIHPYGDLIGGRYRTMDAFEKVLAKWKSNRAVRIGEISGDPQALYDWTVATIAKHPDIEGIYYLDETYELFFEKGSWPAAPVVSDLGRKFAALFNATKVRRRAAGK